MLKKALRRPALADWPSIVAGWQNGYAPALASSETQVRFLSPSQLRVQTAPRGGCSKKSGTDPVGFRVEKVVPTNSIRSRRGRSCPQSREAPAPGASHPSAEGRLMTYAVTIAPLVDAEMRSAMS